MNKLKMAHDWCMKHGDPENFKLTIAEAWEYADAMQAEADKRKPMVQGGHVEPIKSSVGGVVSNEYWWTNRDEKGNCLHNKKSFGGISCLSCKQLLTPEFLREDKLENFRLDWSCAPDGFDWWAMDESGLAYWYKLDKAPFVIYGTAQWTFTESSGDNIEAPSFSYGGLWQDSLRKRPQ